ncbi:MAG: hypothetical protein AAF228_00010 [Pseudomonadota bacterium]
MALQEMLPFRDEIVAMKAPPDVKSHSQIIKHLSERYNVNVSKTTVTRFLRAHAPHLVNSRTAAFVEAQKVIPSDAELEIEAEIIAMREQLGLQIDTLTDNTTHKLDQLSEKIECLESVITKSKAWFHILILASIAHICLACFWIWLQF